ncbi:DUF3352 domain-containing protein [bacterium]|nr:DUF3352 domain-containing protein [bacterium]MCI0602296.1 DUF3352 domain-containing protein [bacterium]
MKKALIALLILVLAGAGVYWFFLYSDRNYPERILPENTAVYLTFSGVDQMHKKGSETLLWKKIATSPRKKLYQYHVERLMRFTESVAGVDPRPLLSQFTREIAVAAVPVTGVQSGVLLAYVRKVKQTHEFLEMKLDPGLKRRFPHLHKAPLTYQNQQYFKYTSDDFPKNVSPCYTFLDHHLIVTSSEVGMKVILDVKAKKLQPLRSSEVFEDAKDEVHFKRGILFFLNAKNTIQMMRSGLKGQAELYWPAFIKISGIEAIGGVAYSIGFEGEGFREEGYVTVDKKRQGIAKVFMQQKPQKLSGVAFLPATSHAAGAGTLPDGMHMWKEVQTQVESVLSGKQFSEWRSLFDFLTGYFDFNFQRDLVEPIGNQFSFAYDSAGETGNSSETRYFFALEVKKPDHFRSLLERLVVLGEERGIRRKAELYQGKTLQVLEVQAGGTSAVPAFWLEGTWFYFGSHQDFVKQSIDSMKNKKNLPTNADFQRVTKGFPAEMNGISYTNTQATLHRYASVLQAQSNETERRWIREYGLLEEMNDLSKSLFGSASYVIVEEEGVRYQAHSSVPTSFLILPAILSATLK